MIGGQRLLIEGNADGWVYAIQARTGEKVWGFQLTKAGINITVAVTADGDTVYAAHSEENVDTPGVMGRVVAIDATGTGDVTKTHERWRADELGAGFPSPLGARRHGSTCVDNSANLFALDAKTGKRALEAQPRHGGQGLAGLGRRQALRHRGERPLPHPEAGRRTASRCSTWTRSRSRTPPRARPAATPRSTARPPIAYGRVYLATEAGLYCLGDKKQAVQGDRRATPVDLAGAGGAAVGARGCCRSSPAEVADPAGRRRAQLPGAAFDAQGRAGGAAPAGGMDAPGPRRQARRTARFTPDAGEARRPARSSRRRERSTATARVRVIPPLPWTYDFEAVEAGKTPAWWIGGRRFKFPAKELAGGKVLSSRRWRSGLDRSDVFLGPADLVRLHHPGRPAGRA